MIDCTIAALPLGRLKLLICPHKNKTCPLALVKAFKEASEECEV